ncbi:MAG TPA: T9SS type A sorting domain-containing protein [Bacteroidales bacterium]|nr:T9SS type A sorting domain-containing protein [Bacteroidales bacterium]HPI29112.1 T9SS type A sorting domain-containing protein [Bacteroidales bacterium]HQN15478.1 T9SS type A sorting domain-containing protein [Bacteroidales bacterium]HQP14992.1 T9SS type A sorting domain-containing protein [Bacteroidales bacterium]
MKKIIPLIFTLCLSLPVFSQNHAPTAVNDYVVTKRGHVIVDILANDFDVDGDSISMLLILPPDHGVLKKLSDREIEYTAFPSYRGGLDSIRYKLMDNGSPVLSSYGYVIFDVDNPLSFDSVAVNNISACVNADGFLFAEYVRISSTSTNIYPWFSVPKGKKTKTIYSGNVWIGGLDDQDSLHVAAQRYYTYGCDFWAGPVSSAYDSLYDDKYKRLWKINRSDIDYHLAHWQQPGYTPSQILLDWPGNGDVLKGESPVLAPFYDNNNDGIYDPYTGDYPLIKGDETVLFIFNDDREQHTETGGKKLGIEGVGMLYGFDCPSDSALWNTVFLNVKINNRSVNTYHNSYIATYTDFSLGDPTDDYIACDVQRGSFYCYNGDNIDGYGRPQDYGAHPPAQAITFLGGPYLDSDGLDNPAGNCDESVNGLNFGNSVIDDERHGMSSSGPHWCFSCTLEFCPSTDVDYYNYMRGFWGGGAQMHYWGNGHPDQSATGPACYFMFPGDTDPCNWGTRGIDPGGTEPWTEEQAGNLPYDRRSAGSSGPFTFFPGAIQELDLAYVFARNFADTNAKAAITVMNQRIDSVRSYFIKDATPCGEKFSMYKPEVTNSDFLYLYPNPASEFVELEYFYNSYSRFEIYDALGHLVKSGDLTETRKQLLDISSLRKGLYFIRITGGIDSVVKKFVKY